MTKAEEFDKARRLVYKGDFSLLVKLYDPDCKHFDHRFGVEMNLDMQSVVISANENSLLGSYREIYENEETINLKQNESIGEIFIFLKRKNHLIAELKDKHLDFLQPYQFLQAKE